MSAQMNTETGKAIKTQIVKSGQTVKHDLQDIVSLFGRFVEEAGEKFIKIGSGYLRDNLKTVRKRIDSFSQNR